MRIGLVGSGTIEIPSIGRKLDHLRTALSSHYDVIDVCLGHIDQTELDLVIDFDHSIIRNHKRPKAPVLALMHGTVARGMCPYPYLAKATPFTNKDGVLVDCFSDLTILADMADKSGGIEKSWVVSHSPLAVDVDRFKPVNKLIARAELGLPHKSFVIGFVGRDHPQKGIYEFLTTVEKLAKTASLFALVIRTPGQYDYADWHDYDRYTRLVDAKIAKLTDSGIVKVLPPTTNDSELSIIYSAMDLLFHPTQMLDENFGYVPLEALACGTPVIGTAWGGLKDTLSETSVTRTVKTWCTDTGPRFDISMAENVILDFARRRPLIDQADICRSVAEGFSLTRYTDRLPIKIQHFLSTARNRSGERIELSGLLHTSDPNKGFDIRLHTGAEQWKSARPFSQRYSSCLPPRCHLSTVLRGSEASRISETKFLTHDPVWPAEITFFNAIKAKCFVAAYCGQTPTEAAQDLALSEKAVVGAYNDFVSAGLLSPLVEESNVANGTYSMEQQTGAPEHN